jgi:hypothetical protein
MYWMIASVLLFGGIIGLLAIECKRLSDDRDKLRNKVQSLQAYVDAYRTAVQADAITNSIRTAKGWETKRRRNAESMAARQDAALVRLKEMGFVK